MSDPTVRVKNRDVHIARDIDIGVAHNKNSIVVTFNYVNGKSYSVAFTSRVATELANEMLNAVEKLREGLPDDLRPKN